MYFLQERSNTHHLAFFVFCCVQAESPERCTNRKVIPVQEAWAGFSPFPSIPGALPNASLWSEPRFENMVLPNPAKANSTYVRKVQTKLCMKCFSNKQAVSLLYLIISDISCPFWLLAHFPWQVQSLHIKLKEFYSIILFCPLSPFLGCKLPANKVPSGCNFLLHIFWNNVRDCSWWAFQEPATSEPVSLPARYTLQLLATLFPLQSRIALFPLPGI